MGHKQNAMTPKKSLKPTLMLNILMLMNNPAITRPLVFEECQDIQQIVSMES